MAKEHEVSFTQYIKNDPKDIKERKKWINSRITNEPHSYIYSDKIVISDSKKFTLHEDLGINIVKSGQKYASNLLITAKNDSVIRMNIFPSDYSEFDVEYISVLDLLKILQSKENGKEYQVDCISKPINCNGDIINSDLVAINIIKKN